MAFLRGRQCRGRGDVRGGANAPKYCKAIFPEDIITYPPKFSKFFLRAGTDFYFKERFGRKNSGDMERHKAQLCFFVSVFLTLMGECGILNRKIFGEGAMKRTFNIVGNVAMWLFLIFAVTVTVFMFSSSSSDDGYPTLFGRVFIPVNETVDADTVNNGDLLIVREKKEKTLLKTEAGNVLIFTVKTDPDSKEVLKIDRVKETRTLPDGNLELRFEKTGFLTVNRENGMLREGRFIAVYSGKKIPGIGGIFGFLVSQTGFISVVIIPLVLLFLFELFNYAIAVMSRPRPSVTEEEKRAIAEKAVADYIKKQSEKENGGGEI